MSLDQQVRGLQHQVMSLDQQVRGLRHFNPRGVVYVTIGGQLLCLFLTFSRRVTAN